jgi:hypothetical protein
MQPKIFNRPSLVALAIKEAIKGTGMYRLGAVITKGTGNKPVVAAHNTNKRTTYLKGDFREIRCCQHAEMAAATKLINGPLRNKQIKVARVSF